MGRSSSRKKGRRKKRRSRPAAASNPPRQNPYLFLLVIGLGILLSVAILFSFPAQDRPFLALVEVIIFGLGFIVYGAGIATEKALLLIDDSLYVNRGGFRRRIVPLQVLESIYLIGVVVGFFRAFIQPRRTWPALPWILVGMTVGAAAIALIVVFEVGKI